MIRRFTFALFVPVSILIRGRTWQSHIGLNLPWTRGPRACFHSNPPKLETVPVRRVARVTIGAGRWEILGRAGPNSGIQDLILLGWSLTHLDRG